MRKRRYLAPWHCKVLDESALQLEGKKAAEALVALEGKPAIYHCVSRIVNRDFVLHREEKDQFLRLMRRYEAFSQVTVRTHCVMTNHFHILVDIPAPPEDGGASWSDEKLLKHLGLIYGETKLGEIRWELGLYRKENNTEAADEQVALVFPE